MTYDKKRVQGTEEHELTPKPPAGKQEYSLNL